MLTPSDTPTLNPDDKSDPVPAAGPPPVALRGEMKSAVAQASIYRKTETIATDISLDVVHLERYKGSIDSPSGKIPMPTAASSPRPPPLASVTASRIAEIICEADGLPQEARLSIERKLRRLATGRQLQDGEQVVGELHRARDLDLSRPRGLPRAAVPEFARLGVDVDHAERALSLATFSLGRHANSATSGLDAILEAVRATDGPMVLEVMALPYRGQHRHPRPRGRAVADPARREVAPHDQHRADSPRPRLRARGGALTRGPARLLSP